MGRLLDESRDAESFEHRQHYVQFILILNTSHSENLGDYADLVEI